MTLRADSYGTVAEVLAFTRHLLSGQSTYNSTTRPTLTEVERFIDRASGMLNLALRGCGLTVPITNSTAKLACADWVVDRATIYTELTQRGTGFSDSEGSRVAGFNSLQKMANEFASDYCLAFKRLGVGVSDKASDGLQFTALEAPSQRTDRDDTTLEQPLFRRGQFDEPSASTRNLTNNEEDDD